MFFCPHPNLIRDGFLRNYISLRITVIPSSTPTALCSQPHRLPPTPSCWGRRRWGNAFSGKPTGRCQCSPLSWELPAPHLGKKWQNWSFLGLLPILVYFRAPCDSKCTSSFIICVMLGFPSRLHEGRVDHAHLTDHCIPGIYHDVWCEICSQ